jgi:acyl phosphate:glycerol-3-phosphate acyltransferase
MTVLLIVFGYLLGAVPFGLIVGKILGGKDPRASGSSNLGATNVGRECGMSLGILTLVLDVLKGVVPVSITLQYGGSPLQVSLVAFAVLLGHCYPVYLKFKGGKGVATAIGVYLPIAWGMLVLALLVHLGLMLGTGFMSVASLGLVTAMFLLLLFGGQAAYAPLGLAIMILVFWRHRENIQRLARGEESPWRRKKDQS